MQELRPRRGTSALFDSFSYLSSKSSPWKHTLVAWTGEIDPIQGSVSSDRPEEIANVAQTYVRAAAPISLSTGAPSHQASHKSGLKVSRSDRTRLEKQLEKDFGSRIAPVWLPDHVDTESDIYTLKSQGRWRAYAERELYTVFHYKINEPNDGKATRKAWADYYAMNKFYADRILQTYQPGDIIMIHDYSLLLLPSLLRQKLPEAYIGFFLHIPFPSSEYFRCLSRRKEVLEGVLGANMVGFQSHGYARHFSSCCSRILGFESSIAGVDAYGAHVAVDVFPIGIDAAAVEKAAFGDSSLEERIRAIREDLYPGKKIIVGRDRQDSVRGVGQKLEAFKLFLELYPEWRDQVVLIQITSPSDMNTDPEDGERKFVSKVSGLVAEINGLYGSLSFSPVRHYPQYLTREEYLALLRAADVGLITSVRDGMNTTSLEYVIAQKNTHSPLILSEFSGTAASLVKAIQVNPWDFGSVASQIDAALRMEPVDKQAQHAELYQWVTTNNVQTWTDNVIDRLVSNLAYHDRKRDTPALDRPLMLSTYRAGKRRLFMFDYDGTLTPIVRDPSAAIPSDKVLRTLKTLAENPDNLVWIISGRDQAFLDEWMGHIPELGLSAEHGAFIRHPNSSDWENVTESTDMSWQEHVMSTFQKYTEKTPGSFIERKKVALTWHYRQADPVFGPHQSKLCEDELNDTVAKSFDVEVMTGKCNLEVRPRFVNKGEIVKRLVAACGADGGEQPDFVFCAGDDFTDEGKSKIPPPLLRALRKFGNHTDLGCRHVPLTSCIDSACSDHLQCYRWGFVKTDACLLLPCRAFGRHLLHIATQWRCRRHRCGQCRYDSRSRRRNHRLQALGKP